MKPDSQFTLGHGYRCLLPDLRLFVELGIYGWEAIAFEEPVKDKNKPIFKQNIYSSEQGRNECKLFVNSWRSADRESKHKPLTAELEWEEY